MLAEYRVHGNDEIPTSGKFGQKWGTQFTCFDRSQTA
jgi:hypothetical protein